MVKVKVLSEEKENKVMGNRNLKGQFVEGVIPQNKIVLPETELKKLYQKLGATKISNYFGVSKPTVLRNLHDYNVTMKESGAPSKMPEYWKEALRKPKNGIAWNKGKTKETDNRLMLISKNLIGQYKYPERHQNEKVECSCGCGELIDKYDKKGRRKNYKVGHCKDGHFITERVSGGNNNHWKGGITPINEKIRTSIEYDNWRKNVYKRDKYSCQICGKKKDIVAHHIKAFADYPDLRFNVENGITLCRSCHFKVHRGGCKTTKKTGQGRKK